MRFLHTSAGKVLKTDVLISVFSVFMDLAAQTLDLGAQIMDLGS